MSIQKYAFFGNWSFSTPGIWTKYLVLYQEYFKIPGIFWHYFRYLGKVKCKYKKNKIILEYWKKIPNTYQKIPNNHGIFLVLYHKLVGIFFGPFLSIVGIFLVFHWNVTFDQNEYFWAIENILGLFFFPKKNIPGILSISQKYSFFFQKWCFSDIPEIIQQYSKMGQKIYQLICGSILGIFSNRIPRLFRVYYNRYFFK